MKASLLYDQTVNEFLPLANWPELFHQHGKDSADVISEALSVVAATINEIVSEKTKETKLQTTEALGNWPG